MRLGYLCASPMSVSRSLCWLMLTRPGLVLRLEALAVLAAALAVYATVLHGRWWVFAAFFLAPDLSLLGYAWRGHPGAAAAVYNAAHTYLGPFLLAAIALRVGAGWGELGALIWIAHIAFDRVLGFGLKYPEAFKPTHLQTAAVFRA